MIRHLSRGILLWLATSDLGLGDLHLIGLEDRVESQVEPAVFGDQTQKMTLKIDGLAGKTGNLCADLFQVAGVLALPLDQGLHLQDGLTLSNASQQVPISIKFPSVKKWAKIRVHFYFVQNGTTPLSDLQFDVFPISLTRDLNDSLKAGATSPFLFGPGQQFRHFLADQHVAFEDGGPNTPDQFDPKRLYFGELKTRERFDNAMDHRAGARMVLFFPDDTLSEGVYLDKGESGFLVHINSPLLDNLKTDPRQQCALLKLINLISSPQNP